MKPRNSVKKIIKLTVLFLSFGFIAYKISHYINLNTAIRNILSFSFHKTFILFLTFALMPVNWGIESIKWRFAIKKIEYLTFRQSLKGVFSGVTAAFFTPNRIGELGGRIFVLKKENRIQGIFCTGIASLSQLTVTIIAGLLSLIVFTFQFPHFSNKLHLSKYETLIIATCLILFSLYVYLNFSKISKFFTKINLLKKKVKYFHAITSYTYKELVIILTWSTLRYVIFSTQFYLLLLIFGVDLNFFEGFISIALIYLITSFIPSIALSEFGIKGSVGIIIISFFSCETFGIISVSVVLWFINLVIPALIGTILFYKSKI